MTGWERFAYWFISKKVWWIIAGLQLFAIIFGIICRHYIASFLAFIISLFCLCVVLSINKKVSDKEILKTLKESKHG